MPEITRSFPVSAAVTRVANAFGGLIYIDVPEDADLGHIERRRREGSRRLAQRDASTPRRPGPRSPAAT